MTAGTWVALRTGIGRVPDTLRWGQLVGGAGLAGIGFTVALFVTELALDDEALVSEAKIGILAGSMLAALSAGWCSGWPASGAGSAPRAGCRRSRRGRGVRSTEPRPGPDRGPGAALR